MTNLAPFIEHWIGPFWLVLWIIWWLAAFTSKRSVQLQSPGSRIVQSGLFLIGMLLIFNIGHLFREGWLVRPVAPHTGLWILTGAALAVAGVSIALWARVILGSNWSGRVTIKQDHELIQRGPYAFVRHPIYTGLLLGMFGTSLVFGLIRCFVGLLIVFLGLWLKSQTEEQFMIQQFGEHYRQYRQHTRALIPFVL